MARKKNNQQHANKKVPSDRDICTVCAAVVHDYNSLIKIHRRVRGMDLIVPTEIADLVKVVGKLHARYEKGDFRHSEREKYSLRRLAQWNVDMNNELRGQEDTRVLTWKD